MDSPSPMSAEFGRRFFFLITMALPWRSDLSNAIVNYLMPGCVLLLCRQNGALRVSTIPRHRVFRLGFPGQIPRPDCATRGGHGTAAPGQFNMGVERRHVLPSTPRRAGSLYFARR